MSPPIVRVHSPIRIVPTRHRSRSRSPQSSKNNSAASQVGSDVSLTEYLDFYGTLFQNQEKQRDDVFARDQDTYDGLYKHAEEKRQAAGARRQTLFVESKNAFDRQFRKDQEAFDQLSSQQHTFHDSRASHRDRRYSAAQATFSMLFDQDYAWVKVQFHAANDAEDYSWTFCKTRVSKLLAAFLSGIAQLFDRHDSAFERLLDSFKKRLGDIDTDPMHPPLVTPVMPSGEPPYGLQVAAALSMSPAMIPGVHVVPSPIFGPPTVMYPSGFEVQPYEPKETPPKPEQEPIRPPLNPSKVSRDSKAPQSENSFLPQTLFTRNIFSNKLPVPDTRMYLYDATRAGLLKMLQDHNGVFIQGQNRRQATFEENLQLRWSINAADVLEDDMKFKEDLKNFQSQAEKRELSHADAFSQDQQRKEKDFFKAEQEREEQFLKAVKKGQEEFVTEMKSMGHRFYSQLEDLMKEIYSSEGQRVEEMARFEVEQLSMAREETLLWKQRFAVAKESRQAKITELLDSA